MEKTETATTAATATVSPDAKMPLLRKRYRLLASGLFLWWLFALISGDIFPYDAYTPTVALVTRACILGGCVIALALLAKWRNALRPWVLRTASLAATVASFVLGFGQMTPMPPVVMYLCGFVAGVCAACFLLGWGALYAKYHLEKTTVVTLVAVAIGGLLLWLESLIPAAGFRGLPMLLAPLVHLGFFYDVDPSAISSKKLAETLPRFNKVCLFTPPVHGVLYGILAGVGLANSSHILNPISGTCGLGIGLVFLAIAALAAYILKRLQFTVIHRPVVVLLVPAIIFGTFVIAEDNWHPEFWVMCAVVLYLTFLWIATCDIADILDLDIIWFLAVRFSASLAAFSVGFAISVGLVTAFSASSMVILAVILVDMALLVLSSVIGMEDQRALDESTEQVVHMAEAEVSLSDMCASLGEKHALSAREVEVLELLAQGRDPSRIQEQLFLSYHTVRNHIKSIYRKLNVHSRQELLDVMEDETELLKKAQAAKPAKKKASNGNGSGRSKSAKPADVK